MADETQQIASRVQSGYDKIAEKYLAWTEHRPSPRLRYTNKLLDQCTTSTTDKLRLLELGCGAGVPVTKYLASHAQVGQVIANDISARMLELARDRVADCPAEATFIPGDMSALNFEPESLHGVAAFFSIIHLPHTAQLSTLKKVHKWLKSGGCIVCNFAAGKQPDDPHAGSFLGVPMYWEHADVEGSVAMFEEAGLRVLEHAVLDVTDGKLASSPNDPDAGAMFLWVVAVKSQ